MKLLIKYTIGIICSIILYKFLTNLYIKVNFHDYTDIMSYMEYINLLKDGKISFISLPKHYFLRFILPYIYYLSSSVMVFSLASYLVQWISNIIFFISLNKYTKSDLKFSNIVLISTISCIAPGIIFANVTMKSEWPSIFAFGISMYFLSSKSIFVKLISLPVTIISRPSLLISVVYQFFIPIAIKNRLIFVIFYLISPLVIFLAFNLIWNYHYGYSFFETGFYTPFTGENGLRNFFKISNIYEFWKIPGKIFYSLLLESNFYLAISPLKNPENLNNLNGILRVILLFYLLYKLILNYDSNNKLLTFLFIYLSIVIPPIILTGFYQTRYFITGDLILYFYLFRNFIRYEKKDCC